MSVTLSRVRPGFLVAAAFVASPMVGSPAHAKPEMPGLEAAASFAQSLAQWEFVIIGASVLILLGTGYFRPANRFVRLSYLLFLPAWASLAYSIHRGVRARETYLAYLLLPKATPDKVTFALNSDLNWQIRSMWVGLILLAVWLVVYLLWWTLTRQLAKHGGGQ